MKHLSILIALFISLDVNAQDLKKIYSPFDFKSDPNSSKIISFENGSTDTVNSHYNHLIDSAFHLDKNYDFEFRLWKRHLFFNADNVFILTLRDGKWTARYFHLKNSTSSNFKFMEEPVDQTKVNQLWMLLVRNKVLTLPTQAALEDRLVSWEVDTTKLFGSRRKTDITDGILYGFELATPLKRRHYQYGCPQLFLRQYGNVEELYRAVTIIMLIQKFLHQTIEVC